MWIFQIGLQQQTNNHPSLSKPTFLFRFSQLGVDVCTRLTFVTMNKHWQLDESTFNKITKSNSRRLDAKREKVKWSRCKVQTARFKQASHVLGWWLNKKQNDLVCMSKLSMSHLLEQSIVSMPRCLASIFWNTKCYITDNCRRLSRLGQLLAFK
jgi:hypothetical protein